MSPNNNVPSIEIEAKFQGGQQECDRVIGWLERERFQIQREETVHRFHVYFDDHDRLRSAGSRLRCVIAPGEWYRYDFKAKGPSGATLEIAIKKEAPVPLPTIIDKLVTKVSKVRLRQKLKCIRNTARIVFVLIGSHHKAAFKRVDMKLEVSWDVLASLETAETISEVEVELLSGKRDKFDDTIGLMTRQLRLHRIFASKVERFYKAADAKGE